jgi:hypothetical protein
LEDKRGARTAPAGSARLGEQMTTWIKIEPGCEMPKERMEADKMIEIRHRRTNEVIYTFPGDTLVGANLWGADLRDANLWGADLRDADLEGAKLERAKLERAKLERANLERAKLERANLEGANLERAYLRGATREGRQVRKLYLHGAFGCYYVMLWDTHIEVGCKSYDFTEFLSMTDDRAFAIDGDKAVNWYRIYHAPLCAMIRQLNNNKEEGE